MNNISCHPIMIHTFTNFFFFVKVKNLPAYKKPLLNSSASIDNSLLSQYITCKNYHSFMHNKYLVNQKHKVKGTPFPPFFHCKFSKITFQGTTNSDPVIKMVQVLKQVLNFQSFGYKTHFENVMTLISSILAHV